MNSFTLKLTLGFILAAPLWADFIAVGPNRGNVARINEQTGAAQIIGRISEEAGLVESLTRDYNTNIFYTVTGAISGAERKLFTLDPTNGNTTAIASLSLQSLSIEALAASPTNGLLYATNIEGRNLYTIDPRSGQVGIVGDLGAFTYSLAFAPDGTLYGYGRDNSYPLGLFRINPLTAQVTVLTPAGVSHPAVSQGLAFAPDGTLWAGQGGGFLQLDPQTGAAVSTFRQTPSIIIGGMAFLPATPVPEPAVMSLIAAGLTGISAVKLRYRKQKS